MLEHIIKNGETIHDILNMYHIELEEIKGVNLHITDFYNLVSGMKIRIPLIHNEIEQILENTESFVQKYYPKVHDLYENEPASAPVIETRTEETKIEPIEEKPVEEPAKAISVPQAKGRPYPGILPPNSPYRR